MTGGTRLTGTVQVAGAKNSVLKLMAAALLARGHHPGISNCPEILDVPLMADVLRGLGCRAPGPARRDRHDHHARRVVVALADFPAVQPAARVGVRARAADGVDVGAPRWALPGGDASAVARWTCTSPACARWAPSMGIEHGSVVGSAT